MQGFALRVGQVLHRGAGHAHAAMKAREQARFGQALHVAAHRLQGHAQGFGQLFDAGGFARAHFFKEQELSGVGIHANGSARRTPVVDVL